MTLPNPGHCLVCDHPIEPFISFGRMPIANGFLSECDFPREYFFELKTAFCPNCSMVQLGELVDETKLFHDAYPFFSSTSKRMGTHFADFAGWIRKSYLRDDDPLVVEIGCNDGIMLKNFHAAGIRHLGVEPSANVAEVARSNGLDVTSKFFNVDLAREIVRERGQADALLGANVMCHIPYLHSVIEGADILLKRKGIISFEDPYLGDIVEKTSYDQIYDEHVFYFSATSVSSLFSRHGFELIDVLPQDVHGGSMRYVLARKGESPKAAAVEGLLRREQALGLHLPKTYTAFRGAVERSRDKLRQLLGEVSREGRRVVGYAATSKSTTVTNYCGLTPWMIEFISDTTPMKQGKFSPGVHIPVRSHDDFKARYPDYALLFGWNHAAEIKANERAFVAAGGRWIEYVPEVRVAS
jgi:methylation protein EvaC